MVKRQLTDRARPIAMIAFMTIAISACSQFSGLFEGRGTTTDSQALSGKPLDVGVYIEELARLASDDLAAHAEIFADAEAVAQLTPGPLADLRLGLVLATPGHSESNPKRAQSLLRAVLAQELLLTPTEKHLATIHLNTAERQIVAEAEASHLRTSSSLTRQTQQRAVAERLTIVEAENRRLRQTLEEAEQKLEAITSIERSIREKE